MEGNRPVRGIDTPVPNAARMYDYFLGGKDNFAADREAAGRSAAAVPQVPWLAWQNRKFLGRAVRFCARAGITQFLDIGSGLPTMENVHQVAEQVITDPHVVYVDHDPVVISHAQALLATLRTVAVYGELTRPEEILADPQVRRLIDFDRPVAVLLVAILHFVPGEADPAGAVPQAPPASDSPALTTRPENNAEYPAPAEEKVPYQVPDRPRTPLFPRCPAEPARHDPPVHHQAPCRRRQGAIAPGNASVSGGRPLGLRVRPRQVGERGVAGVTDVARGPRAGNGLIAWRRCQTPALPCGSCSIKSGTRPTASSWT